MKKFGRYTGEQPAYSLQRHLQGPRLQPNQHSTTNAKTNQVNPAKPTIHSIQFIATNQIQSRTT
jgi:hypothetical protein